MHGGISLAECSAEGKLEAQPEALITPAQEQREKTTGAEISVIRR